MIRTWVTTLAVAAVLTTFVGIDLSHAADQIHTFTGVHLGGNFNDPKQWTPATMPDGDDTALILGDLVDVTATDTVGKLILSSIGGFGAQIRTNGFKLGVNTLTELDGTGAKVGTPVQLRVNNGPGLDFETADMNVLDGADFNLAEGGARVNDDLFVDEASTVTGRGLLSVLDNFDLQGTLRPQSGTLTLANGGTGSLDLDATPQTALLDITQGTAELVVDAPLDDAFNGRINVGDDNRITFAQGWTLAAAAFSIPAGRLNLNGGADVQDPAVLAGGHSNLQGDVNVTGRGSIETGVTFYSSVDVTIAADGVLNLNGKTTYQGGDYTGGRINQNGDVLVNSSTTIAVDHFNMDGNSDSSDWYINPNQTLTLNVNDLVDSGNEFNGQITLPGFSKLVVNTAAPWELGGKAIANGQNNLIYTMLEGQDVNVSGAIEVNDGGAQVNARVHLTGDIATKDADAGLRLGGNKAHTMAGGSITGPGRILTTADSSLTGWGIINARVAFQGDLYASQGTLDLNGKLENLRIIGTKGPAGILDVQNAWNTSLADQLKLDQGEVRGAAITNGGLTTGHGKISAHFVNNGALMADGGVLVLDEAGDFPDLDGDGAENGSVHAVTGDVYAKGNPAGNLGFGFDGTLNLGAGHSFKMDNEGLVMQGKMNMVGGTYDAPLLRFAQPGVLTVTGNATLRSATVFEANSATTLGADLLIDGSAQVADGANFTGPGALVVGPGSSLSGKGTIGVDVVNQGELLPGSSPGKLTVSDYSQTSIGTLQIEIGGKAEDLYDQLITAGAELAGALEVKLINGFAPDYGDNFKVLAHSSRTGAFETVPGGLTPAGKALVPIYGANDVSLFTAVPGDTDLDGDVDLTDFGALKSNFGQTPAAWAEGDADLDGDVDLSDFGLLKDNFGTNVGQAAAVPEPASLVLLGLGGLALAFSRRRRWQR